MVSTHDAVLTPSNPPRPPRGVERLWRRELDSYPSDRQRYTSLTIVVLTTVMLYYEFYLAGGVATSILRDLNMSFVYYVNITVIGYVLGAVASGVAGLADRYGRANIVTVGLLVTGLLSLVGLPLVHNELAFGVVYAAIGFVEGIILVATPALVRDFSPQLGRASAMGFWTLGPVLGSLVVSIVVTNTSDHLTAWQDQYIICGAAGVVVFLVALVGLRELAPALRDQLMVSEKDRALIEARARGIDPAQIQAGLQKPFRQMLRLDVLGSALAISVFLIIYYLAVGFFPIFFQTIFGYSESKANSLGNWFWAFDAGGLVVFGWVSDKLRVRKPFMAVGAIGAIVTTAIFATRATHPGTSHTTFIVLLSLIATFLGVVYAPWMASFTETVERRNPALTATGLAVWGLIIRVVIAVSVFFVPTVVHTVTTLVSKGPRVSATAAKYPAQLATLQKLDPATSTALAANPSDTAAQVKAVSEISGKSPADVLRVIQLNTQYTDEIATANALDPSTQTTLVLNPTNTAALTTAVGEITQKLSVTPAAAASRLAALAKVPVADLLFLKSNGVTVLSAGNQLKAAASVPKADLAYLQANAPSVQKAVRDSPKQWRTYFWIAVGGEVLFIPLVWLMAGYWSPRKAKRAEQEHEEMVRAELAALGR